MAMAAAAAILLFTSVAVATPPAPAGHACKSDGATRPASGGRTARFSRLGDLPPANAVLTVLRTEDGCQTPVIVRYGIGGNTPAQAAPRTR